MYILINKETEKTAIIEAKTDLAYKIGVHPNTITNRFKDYSSFETEKYQVYEADEVIKRNRKGNRDSFNIKIAKSRGEIPKKSEK